ncbi:MAG: cadherin-like domain-containing protein [Candidatus Thiothrix singaporensis]|uniref:Cadherin-like domain-containing protein n=1 Tax=Candidatus Thiothrix singaporensis TaxID=2799669 RepID=A0A7L6ANX8_9GAMM|nr:MAG: cadherin-like domain-containing protein [Candidatus Thiothrix singaporensis]
MTNIAWSAGYAGVNDITAAFNNARRGEEAQLGLAANTLGSLMLPDQSTWNGMSDDAKALYLINSERAARANMQAGVIGLPLAGIESHIDTVAKNYAQLLHDTDTTGHCQPSGDCNIDSPFIRIANSVGSTCKEFITRGENLYYAAASNSSYGSASIQLPVEYAIYTWIYADAGSSWGHREAVLLQNTALPDNVGGFNNNYGSTSNEGFLGFQRLGSSNYAPFPGYGYGVVVVMNVFDPVSDAKAANCGYSLTLRTEDLPSPGNTTNRAPTANADSVTTAFGTSADIAVLDNDTDPDTDTLSITAHTNPSHGSVAVNGGVFTYTPTTGFSGVDSFSYTISDGNGHTATALVTITVSPAPSPSLDAVDDSATTEFNTPIEFNVLANDLNPAGGVLTISANTTPPAVQEPLA